MGASETAGEILKALRETDNLTEVANPGEPPSTKGLNDEAARRVTTDYALKQDAYVAYLLRKPTNQLSQEEQKTLMAAIGQWSREERHG